MVGARGLPLHLERDPVHGLEEVAPHAVGKDTSEAQLPPGAARDEPRVQLEEEVREVDLDEVGPQLVPHRLEDDRGPRHPESLWVHAQRRGLHHGPVPVAQSHRALGIDLSEAVQGDVPRALQVLVPQAEPLGLELDRDPLQVPGLHQHPALQDGLGRRDGEQVRQEARGRLESDRPCPRPDGNEC